MGACCDYDARTTTGGSAAPTTSANEVVCSRIPGMPSSIRHDDPASAGSDVATLVNDEIARIRALPGNGDTTRIRVLVDGFWPAQTLLLGSYEEWVGLSPGCGFRKTGVALGGANGQGLMRVRTPVAPPTAPSVGYLTLRNLYLDGNRRDGGSGSGASPPLTYEDAIANNASPRRQVVATLQIWGCDKFSACGLRFYDSPAYCYHFCNVNGFHVEDSWQGIVPGDAFRGNDHLHWNGYCKNGVAINTRGRSNDDWFAINARDGHDLSSGLTFEPFVASGPIQRIRCVGAFLDGGAGSGEVSRFLTAGASGASFRIEGITIEDVETAAAMDIAGATFDNFGISGSGELRDCALRNWRVGAPVALHFGNTNVLGIKVEDLILRSNCSTAAILVDGSAMIRRLDVDGMVADDVLSVPAIQWGGTGHALNVRGMRWYRPNAVSALPIGAIYKPGGTLEHLGVRDFNVEYVANVVRHSGGTVGSSVSGALGGISFGDGHHRHAGSGNGTVNLAGPLGGVWGTRNLGGLFSALAVENDTNVGAGGNS